MKQFLKWGGIILLPTLMGLALSIVFVASAQAQPPLPIAQRAIIQPTPYPYTTPWGYGGYGPGMMGSYGYGRMGGMMGGYGNRYQTYPNASTPLTIDQAAEAARQYLSVYRNPDLALTEVMEFSNHFYAEVKETSTGIHAFEVLIDRYTGIVSPEPGPNVMWNTKYGHMGGGWSQAGSATAVTPEQARANAQQWLNVYLPGTTAAEESDLFYGYYTVHVMKGGQVYNMLSVNGYSGAIWYHTWHGDFVKSKEMEK